MNGAVLPARTGRMPVPLPSAGDAAVVDDLAAHEVAGVREAVEARGAALLHLPPCSPNPSPIGRAFAEPEALLRGAAERASHLANSGYPRSA